MIRRLVLRVVALVAVAGQLQLVPAAIACAARHDRPVANHCGTDMQPGDGVALTAGMDSPSSPLCAIGVGCTMPPAGLQSSAAFGYQLGDLFAVAAAAPRAPASRDLSPTPPPPQA